MRQRLLEELHQAAGSTYDWSHVTSQIGTMFAFTGMAAAMVRSKDERIKNLLDSRWTDYSWAAGMTINNVETVARAISRAP